MKKAKKRHNEKVEITDITAVGCWLRMRKKNYYLSFVDRFPQFLGATEEELKQVTVCHNEVDNEYLRWDMLNFEFYPYNEFSPYRSNRKLTKKQAERIRKAMEHIKVSDWVVRQLKYFDEKAVKKPETRYEKIKAKIQKWWVWQHSIIDIAFGVALSTVYVRFKILGRGIDFKVELPWCLNKYNPIYQLARGIVHLVSKLTNNHSCCLFWKFGGYKGLELQLCSNYKMLGFEYDWLEHCDHWGHRASIIVAGLGFHAWFADSRHWDYERETFEMYDT